MVTARELRRRVDRLEVVNDQIFIVRVQEDGSVLVTQPGRQDAGEQRFADYEAACQALGLPAGPPDVTIQRSWLS
jgi:hypothetical protein